jgi:hypothetical protein
MPRAGQWRSTRRSRSCASTPRGWPMSVRGSNAAGPARPVIASSRPDAAPSGPTRRSRPGCASRPVGRPRRQRPPTRRPAWPRAARRSDRAGPAAAWRSGRRQDQSIAIALLACSMAPSLPDSTACNASSRMTMRAATSPQADCASAAPGSSVRDKMEAARCRRSGIGSIMQGSVFLAGQRQPPSGSVSRQCAEPHAATLTRPSCARHGFQPDWL